LGKTKYIKVSEETHQALTTLGSKGESYDAILVRLLEHHAKTRPLELHEMERDLDDIEKEAED